MDDTLEKEIRRLKSDLLRKKEELDDIGSLIRKDIDRTFETDPWDLSEREMETFFKEHLPQVKANIDIHPDGRTLTSHRKIFGTAVLRLKRKFMKMIGFYTRLFTDKQTEYNEHSFALLQAALVRSRRHQESLKDVEERLSQCEEKLVAILLKLEDLQRQSDQRKATIEKTGPTTP